MVAGFEAAGVNSGDVTGPDPDLAAAEAFFAEHGVRWGLRVPEEMEFERGRLLFRRRLMALARADFRPSPTWPGWPCARRAPTISRRCCASTRPRSGSTPARTGAGSSRWWRRRSAIDFALATLDGEPVASAYAMRTDGAAGPSLYVAGVAVAMEARRRGVGAAMSSWLLARGFERGAELAHLNPDTDTAARLYARLGFTELPGHDIYVDL